MGETTCCIPTPQLGRGARCYRIPSQQVLIINNLPWPPTQGLQGPLFLTFSHHTAAMDSIRGSGGRGAAGPPMQERAAIEEVLRS